MVRIFYRKNLFFVDTDNYEHFALIKRLGFAWYKYKSLKIWCTPFYSVVEALITNKRIKVEYGKDVQDAILKHKKRHLASNSNGSELELASDDALFPFQASGVLFIKEAVKDYGSVLIADPMGLGKTIQAISYTNEIDNKNILVVCPATLKVMWAKEWKKWSNKKVPIIINYEKLIKRKDLKEKEWDIIIVDEAHFCKNPKAQRTRAIVGGRYQDKGKYINEKPMNTKIRIAITGTPIINRPIELFPILKWLLPYGFSDRMVYARNYCGLKHNGFGWNMNGASNLDELQRRLRSTIMLRRKKEDVLPQLPAKRRQIIEVEPTAEMKKLLKIESKYFGNLLNKDNLNEEEYREVIKKMAVFQKAGFEEMSKVRRQLGELKVKIIINHLHECLEEKEKVVFFAYHHAVLSKVEEHFKHLAVTLTGKTPVKDRQAVVDRFQNEKKWKLFIGNIRAAGVGITLTASSHGVFGEEDWTPGMLDQVEDRIHRIGQTDSVLFQHLVIAGSLDALMCKTTVQKKEIIEKGLDLKTCDFLEG